MQLDALRTGFGDNELEFRLNEVQRNTIANNKLVAQLDYSLKNQNTVSVPSNSSFITPGSEITFSFDKSYLANNSYLNRCKMRSQIKVRFQIDNLTATPHTAANFQLVPGPNIGERNVNQNNHGWDPHNCGLAPFILNKCLSKREIDFSGKSIQGQVFNDMHEIDELACMYNQDTLETLGIYPEKIKGDLGYVGDVYGTTPGLAWFYDGAQSQLVPYSDQLEYLNRQSIAKRNANGKYYHMLSNIYYSGDIPIGGYTYKKVGNQGLAQVNLHGNPANVSGAGAQAFMYQFNPRLDLTADGIIALNGNGFQEIIFSVEEDMISDIFTNLYVDKPRYYAMNSAELNFRFEQSSQMNSLFKSSSTQVIGTPTVELIKMELEFTTFNLGTVQIPFSNFEIPFFLQVSNRQNAKLSSLLNGSVNIDVPVIAYSTVPHYIKIDLFQASEGKDWQKISKSLALSGITLQIDQDIGNALQQMTIQDLYVRTIKNLGMWHQTWEQVFYNMKCEARGAPQLNTGALNTNYIQAYASSEANVNNSSAPILPFLLLKVGTDIRLQSGIEAGMRERINMLFKLTAQNIYQAGETIDVTAKITAYTCGKYVISPINGLLDTVEVSYSRTQWVRRITSMNAELAAAKADGRLAKHHQEYNIPESMVLGGSWFGALTKSVGPVLSGIKNVAKVVGDVVDSKIARAVLPDSVSDIASSVAHKTHDTLSNIGFGKSNRRVKYV